MKKYYAVYRAKDDKLLVSGTARECQLKLGLSSVDSFYCMVSRVKSGRNRKYEIYDEEEIRVEEDHNCDIR